MLRSDVFKRYLDRPHLFREEIELSGTTLVIINEVQKIPLLLDEVHWLHENRGVRFALCGSSARKVRRGQVNLLGGRALRYELSGLSAIELGDAFNLERVINRGTLPSVYGSKRSQHLLRSYVADYLQQEILAEGLTRNLPAFSEFLRVAAHADTEMINFSTIARDCGVSRPTVKGYYEILEDTLLGRLPGYRENPKRRVIIAPKFYFFDVGVVNALAERGAITVRSPLLGKAF